MKLTLRIAVWSFLFSIFLGAGILISRAYGAEDYRQLSREYNLDYQAYLQKKILKLPKKATVELELKNRRVIRGTFQGFVKYDESFWIRPLGKRGLFADEAYDISEILDVKLIIVRSI